MWKSNDEYIQHILKFAGVPYEEPLSLSTFYNSVYKPLFQEALLEIQKFINFSFMRKEGEFVLPAGKSSINLNTKNIKFIQAVFRKGSNKVLEGFEYAKYAGSLLVGNPTAYYFDDNAMTIYFNATPIEDIVYRIIYYEYDLDSDPHPVLNEAPEVLKYLYLAKIYLHLGEYDKYENAYQKYIALCKLEDGLEKIKKTRTTLLKLKHGYESWW